MAVNRAVSSHLDRVGLPGLAFRIRESCGRADGAAATWWRSTPGASPPGGWNEEYEPAILWGGGSADCPGLPRPDMEECSTSPRPWASLARHPVGGVRCGAHRGRWTSPPVRSVENLSR